MLQDRDRPTEKDSAVAAQAGAPGSTGITTAIAASSSPTSSANAGIFQPEAEGCAEHGSKAASSQSDTGNTAATAPDPEAAEPRGIDSAGASAAAGGGFSAAQGHSSTTRAPGFTQQLLAAGYAEQRVGAGELRHGTEGWRSLETSFRALQVGWDGAGGGSAVCCPLVAQRG